MSHVFCTDEDSTGQLSEVCHSPEGHAHLRAPHLASALLRVARALALTAHTSPEDASEAAQGVLQSEPFDRILGRLLDLPEQHRRGVEDLKFEQLGDVALALGMVGLVGYELEATRWVRLMDRLCGAALAGKHDVAQARAVAQSGEDGDGGLRGAIRKGRREGGALRTKWSRWWRRRSGSLEGGRSAAADGGRLGG